MSLRTRIRIKKAVLQISLVPETKCYYELVLTDLTGVCADHGEIHAGMGQETECIFCSDFPIAYFYVGEDAIYEIDYNEDYLEIFLGNESFPALESIEEYDNRLHAADAHYGYFSYDLVCLDSGFEDTIDLSEEQVAELPDGIWYYNTGYKKYHNYIKVNGAYRNYNLFPDELYGNDTYQYIDWKENEDLAERGERGMNSQ